jgi:hypothetical protein
MCDAKEDAMPTTYAHDLFGKKVYQQLPKEIKTVIREHGDLYRIGLHGPDILFYNLFRPGVFHEGIRMHKEKARAFFEQGMAQVRENGDQELLAYLMGFGCHYILDSTCHPYVYDLAGRKVITHTHLETEFDRTMLLENGLNPLIVRPSDGIVAKKSYAKVIHRILPLISSRDIYHSLHMQKFLLNRMVHGKYGIARKLVNGVLRNFSSEEIRELADHFMRRNQDPKAQEPIRHLKKLYDQALAEAPGELEQLYTLSFMDLPLSERWDRTYNG